MNHEDIKIDLLSGEVLSGVEEIPYPEGVEEGTPFIPTPKMQSNIFQYAQSPTRCLGLYDLLTLIDLKYPLKVESFEVSSKNKSSSYESLGYGLKTVLTRNEPTLFDVGDRGDRVFTLNGVRMSVLKGIASYIPLFVESLKSSKIDSLSEEDRAKLFTDIGNDPFLRSIEKFAEEDFRCVEFKPVRYPKITLQSLNLSELEIAQYSALSTKLLEELSDPEPNTESGGRIEAVATRLEVFLLQLLYRLLDEEISSLENVEKELEKMKPKAKAKSKAKAKAKPKTKKKVEEVVEDAQDEAQVDQENL